MWEPQIRVCMREREKEKRDGEKEGMRREGEQEKERRKGKQKIKN